MRAEAEAGDGPAMTVAGAAIDTGGFRYSRSLPGAGTGLTAVALDAAVLAHSNLADIRILRADGRQVPYLLEKVEEPLTIELPALEVTNPPSRLADQQHGTAGARSFYHLRLPYEGLPASRLVLQTNARVFQRRINVLVEEDRSDPRREAWGMSVAEAAWKHGDPETVAPPLVMQLPPLHTCEALVIVEEGDNAALHLGPPRLLLPGYRLRFYREGEGSLSLQYGNHGLSAPRYDLALLAPRLTGAAAAETTPGPENAAPSRSEAMPRRIFWLVLALATAALLLLIVRLLRR